MRPSRYAAAFALAVLLGPAPVRAATPQKAICAVQQVVVCSAYEPCGRMLPGSVNLPVLLKIDRSAGTVISRLESGEERTSAIGSQTGTETDHILQGVDLGTAWSLSVALSTGSFTLGVSRDGLGFIGFGICNSSMLE